MPCLMFLPRPWRFALGIVGRRRAFTTRGRNSSPGAELRTVLRRLSLCVAMNHSLGLIQPPRPKANVRAVIKPRYAKFARA